MNSVRALRNFSSAVKDAQFKHVTVVGGGQMGSGIAQVAAQSGQIVHLVDISQDSLEKSQKTIKSCVEKFFNKMFKDKPDEVMFYAKNVLERIKYSTDLQKSVENADIVVESIVENLSMKQKVFASIEKVAPEDALLCTNTSSISVTKIGSVLENQERFGAVHFFNPLPFMKLVEVIKGERTSLKTHKSLIAWAKSIGRTPVNCKDTPGFIVNRLLFPLVSEAIRMYERGDATLEDIDTAMKLGANHPMGPIELADLIGHDTIFMICKMMREADPSNTMFAPLKSQMRLNEQGKLGVKTGEGYYKYPRKN